MTYSWKALCSWRRSALKQTRPLPEHEAHFFVILWTRIYTWFTFVTAAQWAISDLNCFLVFRLFPFISEALLICDPASRVFQQCPATNPCRQQEASTCTVPLWAASVQRCCPWNSGSGERRYWQSARGFHAILRFRVWAASKSWTCWCQNLFPPAVFWLKEPEIKRATWCLFLMIIISSPLNSSLSKVFLYFLQIPLQS